MVLLRFHLTLVYCYGIQSALCPPPPPSTKRLAEPSLLTGASQEVTELAGTPRAPLPAAQPSGALALLRTRPFATFLSLEASVLPRAGEHGSQGMQTWRGAVVTVSDLLG